jgi:hypothetical protein
MELILSEDPLSKKLSECRRKLSRLKKESMETKESIDDTIAEIAEKHFKDLSHELQTLDSEISFLELKQRVDDEIDEEEIITSAKQTSNKDLKAIFHKVAKLTHPDKVGDKFIEEFKTAQEAYQNGDIETLEEILEIVSSGSETLVRSEEDVEKMLSRLQESIREEEERIQQIKNSLYAKIIELYNSENKMTNIKARHALSEMLFKSIEEKTARLYQLQNSGTM